MPSQNSSGDDGSRHDGSRTDNIDVDSREHSEELNHFHDAFERIMQFLDGLLQEDPELRAFVEQQGGNVDRLPEEGDEQQGGIVDNFPEEGDEKQGGNADSLPAEDHAATAGLRPDPWQSAGAALAKRVQAVIVYYLRRMSNAEVSEMLEQGLKSGIFPNPNTPLETKVHTERKSDKERPSDLIYKKKTNKKKPEPSDEAGEVCHSPVCCDPRRYSVISHIVFFSLRISWFKQPNAGRATTVKVGAEEAPPWRLDSEEEI